MATAYIGADVDFKMTELAVERGGQIVVRDRIPTDVRSLREFLDDLGGRKVMVIEEGSLAGWLYRNLHPHVDRFVIADPRRNRLVYNDGDKTDALDAAALAALCRSGHVREVYHTTDDGRLELKKSVVLYHDRVKEAVRQINKLRASCREYGIRVRGRAWKNKRVRAQWMRELQQMHPGLIRRLEVHWIGYDAVMSQVKLARSEMARRSKEYPIIGYWQELPGIGLVRAATLFAYLDTAWRFKTAQKLWKYCGLGLKRTASGTDNQGRPRKGYVHLYRQVNRKLKAAVQGAALSAIRQGGNPFSDRYVILIRGGTTTSNARHTVGRKLLSVMWGMWKTQSRYSPSLV